METILVHTDGSCLGNGKTENTGGWAYICENDGRIGSGGEKNTTNNRMELCAAIYGLRYVTNRYPRHVITLHSDSQYVLKGCTEWKNGWKKRDYARVKNEDLWRELHFLVDTHKVKFVWVRGHNGDKFNEQCDILAKGAAKSYENG